MDKQLIITVGRKSGSGGLEVARKLGERLGITVYDQNIFEHIGEHFNIDTSELQKYDETPRLKGITRTVNGFNNSPEAQVVELQRSFIRDKAEEGKSFVILGRVGIGAILDWPCELVRVFINSDTDFRMERIMERFGYNEKQARKYIAWVDAKRRHYHDQFCPEVKWGDPDSYDIVLKCSKLGIDKSVDFLEDYVRMRLAQD